MSSVQSRRHGSHLDIESVSDAPVVEISEVTKEDNFALALRQSGDPVSDRGICSARRIRCAHEFDVSIGVRRPALRRGSRSRGVDHDSPQPRFERSFAAIAGPRLKRPRERLLDDIGASRFAACNRSGDADELAEAGAV